MFSQSKNLIIFLLFLILIGCSLIYTTDRYLFKYSHQTHLEMEMDCTLCHVDVSSSNFSQDNNLPKKKVCSSCHEVDDNDECQSCHNPVDKARKLKQRETDLHFSHKMHFTEIEIDCKACHGKVVKSSKATDKLIPPMDKCEGCHDTKSSNSDCELCHTGLKDLVLRPKSHINMNTFLINHKRTIYTKSIKYCQNCHNEESCIACHEGRIDRNVHNRNFRYYHSIIARSNPSSCDICHRKQFCKECH